MEQSLFKYLIRYKPTENVTPFENYITQSFCWLLNYSIENKTKLFSMIMNDLLNYKSIDDISGYKVETQQEFIIGGNKKVIPDITIKDTNENIIYLIEVKVDSKFRMNQIEDYKMICKDVISITKYFNDSDALNNNEKIRWFEVSSLLRNYKSNIHSEIFLIDQFVNFLNEEGMEMKKVDITLVEGLRATYFMLSLIKDIMNHLNIDVKGPKLSNGGKWIGFTCNSPGWNIGIDLDYTDYLQIDTDNKKIMNNFKLAVKNDMKVDWEIDKKYILISFTFNDYNFFSKNRDEQENILHNWIRSKLLMMGVIK